MIDTAIKDYSQNGEQSHILSAFREGKRGRFLDIGAFHPTCFSNTRALWELGWAGVMIEPSPGPFMALLNEYGNDERIILVHAALATERSLVEFYATDDAVSTTERKSYEMWREHAAFKGRFYVPTITLQDIFNQFGGFDFINIDTEGTSVDVLAALLNTELYPPCICVEHDGRVVEASGIAQAKGYRTLHLNGTNLIVTR